MNRHSWTIRSYEVGDEKDYLKLMNIVFPSYKCDLKRWRWEFKENPFGFLQVFGNSDGKIVGTMGLIGVPIKVNEATVQGSQAVDLAVHPESRGKGLFVEMGRKLVQEAKSEGFVLSYGVPNEPAYHGHMKYGWFHVSEIPVLTKMISKKALVLFTLARLRDLFNQPHFKSILNIMVLIRNLKRSTGVLVKRYEPLRPDSFTKRTVTLFDEQFDRLWKEASVQHQLLIVRNEKYLNWRYIERPYSNYVILAIERSNAVEGYVVLSTEVRGFVGWKKGYIVDIFAKSKEGIHFLIQLACDYFAKANADLATCWMMKNQLYYGCLVEQGFVEDTFSSQKLICRINTSDSAFRSTYRSVEGNWFFTIGDSDCI